MLEARFYIFSKKKRESTGANENPPEPALPCLVVAFIELSKVMKICLMLYRRMDLKMPRGDSERLFNLYCLVLELIFNIGFVGELADIKVFRALNYGSRVWVYNFVVHSNTKNIMFCY